MFQIDPGWFRVDAWLIVVIVVFIIASIALTVIWGVRAHRRRVSAGKEELVGMTAEVKIALEPKGTVFVQGEQWTAISEKDQIKPGEEVVITKVEGLKLYVTRKE